MSTSSFQLCLPDFEPIRGHAYHMYPVFLVVRGLRSPRLHSSCVNSVRTYLAIHTYRTLIKPLLWDGRCASATICTAVDFYGHSSHTTAPWAQTVVRLPHTASRWTQFWYLKRTSCRARTHFREDGRKAATWGGGRQKKYVFLTRQSGQ